MGKTEALACFDNAPGAGFLESSLVDITLYISFAIRNLNSVRRDRVKGVIRQRKNNGIARTSIRVLGIKNFWLDTDYGSTGRISVTWATD